MGDLRFTVPHADEFDPRVWDTAYITGIEGIPWHCHHQLDGDQFSIGRQVDESGKLNIVWPTRSIGNVCLTTTSLRVVDSAYCLAVEVARGTVSRLRSQTAEWQRLGLRLPDKFFPLAEDALRHLLRALTSGRDTPRRLELAQKAIDLSMDAATLLCNTFSAQALEARRQSEGRLATLLGLLPAADAQFDDRPGEFDAFNLLCIPVELGEVESSSGKRILEPFDHQVEWAQREGKKICVGPLVNFRPGRLPRWMVLFDEGFESILRIACAHAESIVERYRGRVHLWNSVAGLTLPNELGWSDEQILRMAVSLIETVRHADERTPVLLTIDQPWSEYLRDDPAGVSPLHFADAIIRADLGLSGVALDLTMDAWPNGSLPRDLLEVNRLIDRWSMLGLPLMVILNSPLEALPDPTAESQSDSATESQADSATPGDRVTGWRTPSPGAGAVAPDALVRLLLSKPCVHAIIWNDAPTPEPRDRSLWNGQGQATPLLSHLANLRRVLLH